MKHPKQWKFKVATCTMGKKRHWGACLLSSHAANDVPHPVRVSSFLERSPTGSKAVVGSRGSWISKIYFCNIGRK
jgi:hypothetical protein